MRNVYFSVFEECKDDSDCNDPTKPNDICYAGQCIGKLPISLRYTESNAIRKIIFPRTTDIMMFDYFLLFHRDLWHSGGDAA